MLKKIRNKIILSNTTLVFAVTAFILIFFNYHVRDIHLKIIEREMKEKIRIIEYHINDIPGFLSDNGKFKKEINDISGIIDLRITIVIPDGNVIADSMIENVSSMDNHLYRLEIKEAIANNAGKSIRYSNTLDTDMLYYAERYNNIIIRLAKPLHEVDESVGKTRQIIVTLGIIILLFAITATVLASRKVTGPINEAILFAGDFARGDYSKRIRGLRNDEIGALQRSLNSMADIISEKIDSLILEQNKLKVTIESIRDGIAVIDNNKKIVIANRAFSSLLEIKIRVENKMYYEVIRNRALNIKIDYCVFHGKPSSFEESFPGEKICEVYINAITDDNTIKGILVVLHDITEQRTAEKMKTDLVGNIAHELKTPIAILKGYLETVIENPANEKQAMDFIKKAVSGADRLNSIINDMLTLNMIETSPDFTKENININKIIDGCIDILQPKIITKEIQIETDIDLTNTIITGNKFLAEAIFFNLIENAINYNIQKGKIKIRTESTGNKTGIHISDTGIGIPEDSIHRIFERFYRVDKSRSRATGGTGLGLSIVKHAANLLLWSISVTSSPEGSTFTIEI